MYSRVSSTGVPRWVLPIPIFTYYIIKDEDQELNRHDPGVFLRVRDQDGLLVGSQQNVTDERKVQCKGTCTFKKIVLIKWSFSLSVSSWDRLECSPQNEPTIPLHLCSKSIRSFGCILFCTTSFNLVYFNINELEYLPLSYHQRSQTSYFLYPSMISFLCFKINTSYLLIQDPWLNIVPLISIIIR